MKPATKLDLKSIDFLSLFARDIDLRQAATTNGGEYKGPCPWCGGEDRFCVWPEDKSGKGRYWCRQCERKGDAIDYLRDLHDMTYAQALEELGGRADHSRPPRKQARRKPATTKTTNDLWQDKAAAFVARCHAILWSDQGQSALDWLRGRALSDETIKAAGLGYNPTKSNTPAADWGLEQNKPVWLFAGIVIPWKVDGKLQKVRFRRLKPSENESKYIQIKGSANGLYNADSIETDRPVVLVEGEIDALSIGQETDAIGVATGGTSGARLPMWIAKLATLPAVLVAYDEDENGAGDKGAVYWLDRLDNAKRWRPYWGDANELAQDGVDLKGWIAVGLDIPEEKPHLYQSEYETLLSRLEVLSDELDQLGPEIHVEETSLGVARYVATGEAKAVLDDHRRVAIELGRLQTINQVV